MTTSIEDLVKRLCEGESTQSWCGKDVRSLAADALESLSAQAAKYAERIKQLEIDWRETLRANAAECSTFTDRISTLEAQLTDLAREKEEAEFHANEMNAACDQLTLERDVAKERIMELEERESELLTIAYMQGSEVAKDRISTLEAQLKAFREAARLLQTGAVQFPTLGDPQQYSVRGEAFDALMSALRNVEGDKDET